jgi:hypothetical protein
MTTALCTCAAPNAENNVKLHEYAGGLQADRTGGGESVTDGSDAGTIVKKSSTIGSDAPLPATTKGYELYAWEEGEELWFTLITGTNRLKALAEVTAKNADVHHGEWVVVNGTGFEQLRRLLSRVPSATSIIPRDLPGLPRLSDVGRADIKSAITYSGH